MTKDDGKKWRDEIHNRLNDVEGMKELLAKNGYNVSDDEAKKCMDSSLMSDREFTLLMKTAYTMLRKYAKGKKEIEPLAMVALLGLEEIGATPEQLCEEMGLTKEQYDEAKEKGVVRPFVMLPPPVLHPEHKHQWFFEVGKVFPKHPIAIFLISEAWGLKPDEDNPERFKMDVPIRDHPDKTEVAVIVGLTLDQRAKYILRPIDRTPEGEILIGEVGDDEIMDGKGTADAPLLRNFWLGYGQQMGIKHGFLDADGKPKKDEAQPG